MGFKLDRQQNWGHSKTWTNTERSNGQNDQEFKGDQLYVPMVTKWLEWGTVDEYDANDDGDDDDEENNG